MKNYYKILGVSPKASQDEIKSAFRKLAHQYHPDKKGGNEKKFKEINEAYQILSDKEKKAQYDRFGRVFEDGQQGFDFGSFREGLGRDFGWDAGFDFGRVFEEFFAPADRRKDLKKGKDIRIEINIPLEATLNGTEREIRLKKEVTCSRCDGTGGEPNTKIAECFSCRGSGEVQQVKKTFLGSITRFIICPECKGEGSRPEKPCNVCKGEGKIEGEEKIQIFIPAGIDHNQTLRVSAKGNAGRRKGRPGDLFIRVSIKKHPVFERRGDDLIASVPITFSQAALGDKIEIPTLEGEKKELRVPNGTQSRAIFELRGKGIPHFIGLGRGSLYVEMIVETPKKLSQKQKELLEKLRKEGL